MPQQQITDTGNFERNIAVVIGIDVYENGIPRLTTASNDAQELTRILREVFNYDVIQLLDGQASLENLWRLLNEILPKRIQPTQRDRLLFYFAGHGTALNSENEDGPAGYILPQDAQPEKRETFLPMQEVHDALTALDFRHSLMILDCCFAGAFRWSTTRDISIFPEVIHKERYDRFIKDPAWQVITSAAYDQKALDILVDNRGVSMTDHQHSPFAHALFEALQGSADLIPDGIITATELYLYLRDRVELRSSEQQTPGLWHLRKHQKGEYIFLLPGYNPDDLPPAPELNKENNPYRGLESFDEAHTKLFFGREQRTEELVQQVSERSLTVVVGASGTGKSSLVKAGVLPRLRQKVEEQWYILDPIRPGESPLTALARGCLPLIDNNSTDELAMIATITQRLQQENQAFAAIVQQWADTHSGGRLLLVVDQFEELVTLCRDEVERQQFLEVLEDSLAVNPDQLRIIITLRSDFEPQFLGSVLKTRWIDSRFVIPPMTQDELRQAIEGPASERVLYFEPATLVDRLINEVVQTPGALPLLSFTLSELYLKYLERRGDNRALTEADYRVLGGVAGSLTQRATQEYEQLTQQDDAYKQTVKRVMLRMVAVEGGEVARRRVPESELQFVDTLENERVDEVIRRLVDARLVVGGQEAGGEAFVEPAHDALVRGWDKIQTWKTQEQENIALQRLLTPAAREWLTHKKAVGFLWDDNPRILLLKQVMGSDQNWLNDLETSFVSRSLQRRQNNRRRLVGSVAGVILALSGLTGFAFVQQGIAKDNAKRANVNAEEARKQEQLARDNEQKANTNAQQARKNSERADTEADKAIKNAETARKNEKRANEQADLAKNNAETAQKNEKRANEQADLAGKRQIEAERQRNKAVEGQIGILASLSQTRMLVNDQLGALVSAVKSAILLKQTPRLQSQLRGQVFEALRETVYTVQEKNRLEGNKHPLLGVSFSPDGKTFATSDGGGVVKLWNKDGSLRKIMTGHQTDVINVAFSPDGQLIASASKDKTVKLWRIDGTLLKTFQHDAEVWDVSFSSDSRIIASASSNGTVRLWRISDSKLNIPPIKAYEGFASTVRLSPDGKTMVTGGWDKTVYESKIRVWSIDSGILLKTFDLGNGFTRSIDLSKDGQQIVCAGDGGRVLRLQTSDGHTLTNIQIRDSGIDAWAMGARLSPDGQTIASIDNNGNVKLWDLHGGLIQKLPGHDDAVHGLSFSPDSKSLVTVSADRTFKLWNLKSSFLKSFDGQQNSVHLGVSFSPDGRTLASASWEPTLGQWAVKLWSNSGEVLRTFTGYGESIRTIRFSKDGRFIATASWDGSVKLWTLDGKLFTNFLQHAAPVNGVDLNYDNSKVVSAGYPEPQSRRNYWMMWNIDGSSPVRFFGHQEGIYRIIFSPDGSKVATASWDRTVKLWNASDGTLLKTLNAHSNWLYGLTFSPDGQLLVAAGRDRTITIWSVEGKLLHTLTGHQGTINDIAFSPDGKLIASGSDDTTVKLWSRNGTLLKTLKGHIKAVHGVSFSPDSKTVASASWDGSIKLWSTETLDFDNLLRQGCTWLQDYLKTNPNAEQDRHLCEKYASLDNSEKSR